MSVRADSMGTGDASVSARAEHISLESDPHAAPLVETAQRRRKVQSSYALKSRLRGCATQISILEDHYAAILCVRPHEQPHEYEIDLRFASPKPVRVRTISWFWLGLAACLALLGAGGLWSFAVTGPRWLDPIFLTALLTVFTSLGAGLMFLRCTVESLEFTSMHGDATLISVAGGIGSARAGRRFFVELIKNINAAKAARPQPRPQFLRDEMREHHRLRELGVLTQSQYEQSKARILAAH